MSESVRSDSSTPSLSAYPPAFVSLITTFLQQAEDAEMRAHKALVIIQSKDQQVLQLQERMGTLEKLASRLEEVMVPPLDLPQSSPSSLAEGSPHPRDNIPLETVYERRPLSNVQTFDGKLPEGHNCFLRCQHLIDGLERSNSQLREALTSESTQRVKDHEQYLESLAQVTQAVKKWQSNENQLKHSPEQTLLQRSEDNTQGAGDTQGNIAPREGGDMAVLNRNDLRMSLDKASRIIINLKRRFENNGTNQKFRRRRSRTQNISSRSSSSSYHTPVSSISLKLGSKSKNKSVSRFYCDLKRRNTKLKHKYDHMSQKFKQSLHICEQLQHDLVKLTEQNRAKPQSQKVYAEVATQTVKETEVFNKVQSGRTTNILHGRLDAAAKVMSKQCKHIENLQKQLNNSLSTNDALKKRLSRAEALVAGKDVFAENCEREQKNLQTRNSELKQEVTNLTNTVLKLTQDLSALTEANNNSESRRDASEQQLEEMKQTMETKLNTLSQALQERESMSEKAAEELEAKLSSLRNQFVNHVTEARERLTIANDKIRELYSGIETFLKLLFNNGCPLTPLSPASEAEAVQKASDILQLAPGQIQTILLSSRQDSRAVNKWIKQLNHLVRSDVFSNPLAHALLDAVIESYKLY